MYSYYLPDDPNPYRYSYLPKKNSFISRHYLPDDFNNDDYYGNTKNEYVLYDDFVNNVMNVNYVNIDPRFHSYRDKKLTLKRNKHLHNKQNFISTTGQLILNITDKEFVYYTDTNNSETVKYINKLPNDYVPKIRIIIKQTEKNIKKRKKAFTQKYLKELYKKFNYESTRREKKNRKNVTRKNR